MQSKPTLKKKAGLIASLLKNEIEEFVKKGASAIPAPYCHSRDISLFIKSTFLL